MIKPVPGGNGEGADVVDDVAIVRGDEIRHRQ
jgi:hypothetical protein